MITERDHSHQHERDDNDQYAGLLTTYRVVLHADRALQSHTRNMMDNTGTMPVGGATVQPDRIGRKQSRCAASNHDPSRLFPTTDLS